MTNSQLRTLLQHPEGNELAIGFALHDADRSGPLPDNHASLRSLIEAHGDLNYSTVMRWVRAASVLDGPDDPRRAWGISRLVDLAKLASSEGLATFLQDHDPSALSVRKLRDAIRTRLILGLAEQFGRPFLQLRQYRLHQFLRLLHLQLEGVPQKGEEHGVSALKHVDGLRS